MSEPIWWRGRLLELVETVDRGDYGTWRRWEWRNAEPIFSDNFEIAEVQHRADKMESAHLHWYARWTIGPHSCAAFGPTMEKAIAACDRFSRELAAKIVRGVDEQAPKPPIPGMIQGYWFGAQAVVPNEPPPYPPSYALLPSLLPRPHEDPALVLVEWSGAWLPLSESMTPRTGGSPVKTEEVFWFLREEQALFVTWDSEGRRIRRMEFTKVDPSAPFDPEAVRRCPNATSLVGAVIRRQWR